MDLEQYHSQIKLSQKLCLLILLFSFSHFGSLAAQQYSTKKTVKESVRKVYDKGMAAYRASKNKEAANYFAKALKMDSRFIDAQIQWSAAQYDMKQFAEAEVGFEKAAAIDLNYNTLVTYTLAKAEMALKKYAEAIEHFTQYLELEKKNTKLKEKAKRYVADCSFLNESMGKRVPFEPVKLSANINTENWAEYLPALTADEETMIFTRKVAGQEDFYISRNIDGEWRTAQPMEDINTNANEGAQSISADGKFLVFTACGRMDGIGSCDLYFSEVVNGRWTKAKNIGAPINSRSWESQPSISADGRKLYFASNRGGGFGDKDIWMSTRDYTGKWSTPINLGENINTANSDQSPFIHPDGRTLYFMSDGWPGFGAHDLFYTRLNDSLKWNEPTNLGFPINSKASEGALVISLNGSTAYFASDRDVEGAEVSSFDDAMRGADTDIYSFQLYEAARPNPVTYVKARVFDELSKAALKASVEFVDLNTSTIHSSSITDIDGEFLVCLPLGANYALNVNKEEYIFHSENFMLTDQNAGTPYILEIGMRKIPKEELEAIAAHPEKSKPIVLRNVFFDTGSAKLREESYVELEKLKSLLQEHPNLSIQINGHTDDVGSEIDNQRLSENRSKAVYAFLVEQGIAQQRLSYKGYGESMPIEENQSDEGRQKNRRTEFVITGT